MIIKFSIFANPEVREVEDQLRAELSRSQQITTHHEQERQRLESLLENERQTVSFLVSEKSTLAAEVHRLGEMESSAFLIVAREQADEEYQRLVNMSNC